MFGPKLLNRDEIRQAWLKVEKRKGKRVPRDAIQLGDIFRLDDDAPDSRFPHVIVPFEEDGTKGFELRDAHGYFFPYGVSMVSRHEIPAGWSAGQPLGIEWVEGVASHVRILGSVSEFPKRRFEPSIITTVYTNTDGSICCQNMIRILGGALGQHFKLSKTEYEKLRRRDRFEREWQKAKTPCGCTLSIGEVREHDGKVWKGQVAKA